jgi:hypothetical protein
MESAQSISVRLPQIPLFFHNFNSLGFSTKTLTNSFGGIGEKRYWIDYFNAFTLYYRFNSYKGFNNCTIINYSVIASTNLLPSNFSVLVTSEVPSEFPCTIRYQISLPSLFIFVKQMFTWFND